MAIALCPMGVDPPGVNIGVAIPELPCGVAPILGVILGVAAPKDGVAFEGVSSQRDRLLLVDPGSVSLSPLMRSARGVSAQPLLCPGVSRSVFGVSSQRFLRVDFSCAGVSVRPGVIAWCAGVASQIRTLCPGVAPGVSLPLWPGVSSQWCWAGVF